MIEYPRFSHISKVELAISSIVSLVLTGSIALVAEKMTYESKWFKNSWDHHHYIDAARGPIGCDTPPFCWRILKPSLARLLPFDLQTSNFVLTIIALHLVGVLMFVLARRYGFDFFPSLLGMIMFFTLKSATYFNVWDFWLTDPFAFVAILGCVHAILSDEDEMFALFLAIGVLSKESALFALPLYYTLKTSKLVDVPRFKRTILYGSPAVVVMFAVRVAIPAPGYDVVSLLFEIGIPRIIGLSPADVGHYLFGTFGILIVLSAYAINENSELFIRWSPLIVAAFAQLLVASNEARLVVIAFPPFILGALYGFERFTDHLSTDRTTYEPSEFIPLYLLLFMYMFVTVSRKLQHLTHELSIFIFYAILLMAFKASYKRYTAADGLRVFR